MNILRSVRRVFPPCLFGSMGGGWPGGPETKRRGRVHGGRDLLHLPKPPSRTMRGKGGRKKAWWMRKDAAQIQFDLLVLRLSAGPLRYDITPQCSPYLRNWSVVPGPCGFPARLRIATSDDSGHATGRLVRVRWRNGPFCVERLREGVRFLKLHPIALPRRITRCAVPGPLCGSVTEPPSRIVE